MCVESVGVYGKCRGVWKVYIGVCGKCRRRGCEVWWSSVENNVYSVFERTTYSPYNGYCRFYRWLTENDEVDFWSRLREFSERVFLVPAPPPGLLSLVRTRTRT